MLYEPSLETTQSFHESVHEITDAAVECIENMIAEEEHQVQFIRGFGSLWKVTVEKIGPQEVRFLSFFASLMVSWID